MDEALLEAFRSTTYHVCLDAVRWAIIRVDLPLPAPLAAVVGAQPWAFVTAWNPQARRRPPAENEAAQHELLAALEQQAGAKVYPAIGVGTSGWSEPSLFVTGAGVATLDGLTRSHGQLAYVHGEAGGHATLRILD
ncbi:DUF3293 domain-containing protein [Rhodanobacter sp. PCA2]|uniref:DUF3293 domain-containing protein n=1 Tax=Rhodanobacter sp. PCA2 TaxID=2006117 RepID=UPI0015E654CB|nr:DUF3293 domain-containing protein [Rhodanobacter sp. PCA2]MBA2078587.1 hypothetical protein [Rhodanobacter sp. PCA2]